MSRKQIPVEEYTTPNPVTANEDTPLNDLIDLMKNHEIKHIPIVRGDKVVGIVSDRDIRVVSLLTWNEKHLVCASHIMVKDPVTVSAGEGLEDVALEMAENKIGSVIVNDENDQFMGIFTVTDALNALVEIVRSYKEMD